jgi:hypothetical protein
VSYVQGPFPVQRLVRRDNRRPAILLGLRDSDNDTGVIKVTHTLKITEYQLVAGGDSDDDILLCIYC